MSLVFEEHACGLLRLQGQCPQFHHQLVVAAHGQRCLSNAATPTYLSLLLAKQSVIQSLDLSIHSRAWCVLAKTRIPECVSII